MASKQHFQPHRAEMISGSASSVEHGLDYILTCAHLNFVIGRQMFGSEITNRELKKPAGDLESVFSRQPESRITRPNRRKTSWPQKRV